MRFSFLFLILFFNFFVRAQELNATINVDFSQVQNSNVRVYETLEKSLQTFINTTKWTSERFEDHEKINCNFTIIINNRPEINRFSASIQVFSNRPVFNSNYNSPVISWKDDDFDFLYTLNEQLIFNERRFSGRNLTDVLAFYVYMILGYDADTFKRKGGTEYLEKARQIAINGESQNSFAGWGRVDGLRSRGSLIRNILQQDLEELRTVWYEYHRLGLDNMFLQEKQSKRSIENAIRKMKRYERQLGQYFALEVFLGSKNDEIYNIFSGGESTSTPIDELVIVLKALMPLQGEKWDQLND